MMVTLDIDISIDGCLLKMSQFDNPQSTRKGKERSFRGEERILIPIHAETGKRIGPEEVDALKHHMELG
jgi:hypothetical protein